MRELSLDDAVADVGPGPHRPTRTGAASWLQRVLDLGNRALDRTGLTQGQPRIEHVLRAVSDEPGIEALDRWNAREPLEVWIRALREEADLTALGRLAARWDAVRLLRNLCRLADEETRNTAILDEPITRPIFITGMPRSGTTFLHGLIAQDPARLVPRCWQTAYPYPPRKGPDRRIREVERQLRIFRAMVPELWSLHPLAADCPQECAEILSHVFRSPRFDTTHWVPGYRRWLDAAGNLDAYRFHKRFLQHMQHQLGGEHASGRWVLKCPDHVFALDEIDQVYPDACYVFVHRDPLKVLPSVARLTELLRSPFARATVPGTIGQQVTRDWSDGAARMIEAAQRMARSPGKLLHLQYTALRERPLEVAASLYRHFGLEFTQDASGRISTHLAARPRGGYGRNIYRFEDHGLDPAIERERYRGYTGFFDIPPEPPSRTSVP